MKKCNGGSIQICVGKEKSQGTVIALVRGVTIGSQQMGAGFW